MSQTSPTERVRIFDKKGYELASFMADVSRSWAIGREGRASFEYPIRKTNLITEKNIRFGNYLLIENSILPPWVGIIDTPREWKNSVVTINAYTMERMFSFRRGNYEQKLTGSPGQIFAQLVKVINEAENTIMEVGVIEDDNTDHEETINPNTLDRNLKQLQERTKQEYSFTPSLAGNKLVIKANWLKRLGRETPLVFQEGERGGNIEAPTVREDGRIVNNVLGYGDGTTWANRPATIRVDPESVALYGLRQDSKNWYGVKQSVTLDKNNLDFMNKSYKASKVYDLTALNVGDTFKYIELGNGVYITLQNMGFLANGQKGSLDFARILGMSYNPRNGNKIRLVMEER